jgi:hypothetical protein
MPKTRKDLETENAFLQGRIVELEKRTMAAEDYAEALFLEPCVNCGASECHEADEDDVWPGDKPRARIRSYLDIFGLEHLVPGDN